MLTSASGRILLLIILLVSLRLITAHKQKYVHCVRYCLVFAFWFHFFKWVFCFLFTLLFLFVTVRSVLFYQRWTFPVFIFFVHKHCTHIWLNILNHDSCDPLTPTELHSPGLSRHKRLWCRALLCSNWMWWCGTSPDRPCPTEETKQSVSPAWRKTTQSLSALICLQPRAPYNLKLYGLSVQLNGPDLEVHTDGANVALCVRVILKPTHTQVSLGGKYETCSVINRQKHGGPVT